jgi:hypothetical protein
VRVGDLVDILEIQAHRKLVVAKEVDVGVVGLISGFDHGRQPEDVEVALD